MKNKTTNRWLTTSLVLGLLGCLADYASPIEVSPPSPVPALSPQVVMVPTIKMVPTVITVKCADDALVFILGIVDGMPATCCPETNCPTTMGWFECTTKSRCVAISAKYPPPAAPAAAALRDHSFLLSHFPIYPRSSQDRFPE